MRLLVGLAILSLSLGAACSSLGPTTGPTPTPAYDREEWGGWPDVDGDCRNTRAEVLIVESRGPVEFDDCRVVGGLWIDPWTGEAFRLAAHVEIDHHVPLYEAHRSGGSAWNEEQKRRFSNDFDNLNVIGSGANRSKGSRSPDAWRPASEASWCRYAEEWRAVKSKYGLSAAHDEQQAIEEMLNTCSTTYPAPTPASSPTPTSSPVPPTTITTAVALGPPASTPAPVAYASCAEAEQAGARRVVGSQGPGRGFPKAVVPSARDGDGDGVVCETAVAAPTPTPTSAPVPTPVPTPTRPAPGAYASCADDGVACETTDATPTPTLTPAPIPTPTTSAPVAVASCEDDGIVCETADAAPTPTSTPIPTPTTSAPVAYASCAEAEQAGERRVQGSKGLGMGFPQATVPSARDGDSDGVVCETVGAASTPTPAPTPATPDPGAYASCAEAEQAGERRVVGSKGPGMGFPQATVPSARDGDSDGVVCETVGVASTPTPAPTPATPDPGAYASCAEAEQAGEPRVQGSKGPGKGFPKATVPSARDGDGDGVVCEE